MGFLEWLYYGKAQPHRWAKDIKLTTAAGLKRRRAFISLGLVPSKTYNNGGFHKLATRAPAFPRGRLIRHSYVNVEPGRARSQPSLQLTRHRFLTLAARGARKALTAARP